jgi:5'-nucleotidase / UDP-sugar diphosphatase
VTKEFNSYKKFLATAATSALVVSAAAPYASAQSFSDVNDRYKDAVDFLVSKGAKGMSSTSFGVGEEIKRVDAAVLLANVLELDTKGAPNSGFTDVPARAKGAVNALKAAGITSGKNAKIFGANDNITRGEIAIWLQKGFGLQGKEASSFKDVSTNYKEAVQALVANDITNGVTETAFGTAQHAKRGDFAIFLYKASLIQDEDGEFTLSLMHTNDTHAHLDNVAKRITAIKEVREEKPDALLVDAGDVFSGTLYFNEFKGQADLEFMNLAKYDVMTFGNHEFDLGSSPEGHKALADFVKGAEFPFVSSNVDFSKDSNLKGLYNDTITDSPEDGNIYNGMVKEVNGEEIGFFGLTTAETKDISSPGDIVFEDYIEEAEKVVAEFEEQGIDKIVAVNHIGFDDNADYDNDLELAAQVEGIDVIVGGHSHTELEEPVVIDKDEAGKEKDPTVIVQAYQYSDFLGTIDVEFDENGTVIGQAGQLISVADKAEDPEAAKILKGYSSQIDDIKNTETGATAVQALENPRDGGDATKPSVRKNETPLGNLITDGMLSKAKEFNPDIQIAMQNAGGIRADIPAGPITLGEILTVLPFGNTLATMELSGAEIKDALEHSVSQAPNESGGFLHVSGMKFTYDSTKPAGSRVQTVEVKGENGSYTALDETKSYVITTNAFTAKGGDGYDVFKKAYEEGRVTDLGSADWENLRDYVQKLGDVNPQVEDRIIDLKGESPTNPGTDNPGTGDPSPSEPTEVAADEFGGTADSPKTHNGDILVDISEASTLKNAVVNGDLILTGAPTGEVVFSEITVKGNLDLSGYEGSQSVLEGIEVEGEIIL